MIIIRRTVHASADVLLAYLVVPVATLGAGQERNQPLHRASELEITHRPRWLALIVDNERVPARRPRGASVV
jgi:hypothetical protein